MQKEVDELERKYAELYKPLDQARLDIINGKRDPTPEELAKLEEVKQPQQAKKMPDLDLNELKATKAIPGFWLKAMQNSRELKEHVFEVDAPVLKHLVDIRQELLEGTVSLS